MSRKRKSVKRNKRCGTLKSKSSQDKTPIFVTPNKKELLKNWLIWTTLVVVVPIFLTLVVSLLNKDIKLWLHISIALNYGTFSLAMAILAETPNFIDRPEQHEFFQRKFGCDPKHKKDTRNLTETKTVTERMLNEHKIKQAFIGESLKAPIAKITAALIEKIAERTGIDVKLTEETLLRLYPHGAVGSFMTEYFEMAFKGRDEATNFEKATAELFKTVFGFYTRHVGPIGLTPDVLVLSDNSGYCGIIDNKAYSKYTISNDHHNRMVHNYIGSLKNYYEGSLPLVFFSYIAGGFGMNINAQLQDITRETGVHGSAVSVSNVINLVEQYSSGGYDHGKLREIFTLDRQVLLGDIV